MRLNRWFLLLSLLLATTFSLGEDIAPGKSGDELVEHLRANYQPTSVRNYHDARFEMFSDIDNEEGKVVLVYTGEEFATTGIPDHRVVNTEHTWPQSKFNERMPMRSDLHHLFPTYNPVNNARGNKPFAEIPDEQTERWWGTKEHQEEIPDNEIDRFSESTNSLFEPREAHKGNVARAMIYFYVVHGDKNITADWVLPQLPTLLEWHKQDAVDDRERQRNDKINNVQGNHNPFILDETLFERVLDLPGPTPEMLDASRTPLATAEAEGETIRIGTFNIANFGNRDEYLRSLIALTNIIREMDADLVCLQEVEPNDLGPEQVARLVRLLNKAAKFDDTEPYEFAVSPQFGGDELTAFLWRSPVSMESEIDSLPHEEDPDNDGKRTFQRTPSRALFQAGNYDFWVVNCHLYTRIEGVSSEGRKDEMEAIGQWLVEVADEREKDAIVLGDFNRFLNGKSAWEKLLALNYQNHYRFPLMEAIQAEVPDFDPAKDEAPSDKYSTTTAKKLSIYDQIVISQGSSHEFVESPVFGEDIGLVAFDNDPHYEWFIDSWHDAVGMLSDHRPVWIRVRIDKEDDDDAD